MDTQAQPSALVPTSVLPASLRRLFPFAHFNAMQSACFDAAYGSDASLVVAAPTGSGKTAVLELAIAHLFGARSTGGSGRGPLAVYMAPLKALTHERLNDWKPKLGPPNGVLNVVELTGDSDDTADERAVASADLVCASRRPPNCCLRTHATSECLAASASRVSQ